MTSHDRGFAAADSWLGGVCEAEVAEIEEWGNGVFRGGTLAVSGTVI